MPPVSRRRSTSGEGLWTALQPSVDAGLRRATAGTHSRSEAELAPSRPNGRDSPTSRLSRSGPTPPRAGERGRTRTSSPTACGARPRRCSARAIAPPPPTALVDAYRIATDLGARPLATSVEALATRSRIELTADARRLGVQCDRGAGRSLRPDPARARRPAAAGQGADEPPDRRGAVHQREHGRRPRLEHPRQARGHDTDGGGRDRREARSRNGLSGRIASPEGGDRIQRTLQFVTMTASRYSLSTIIVPSSARLKRAMRSSRSPSSPSRPASPTASNALSVGP